MPRIQPASRWTVFDPLTNAQNILVNILPLDEQVEMGGYLYFLLLERVIYIYKKTSRDLLFFADI